MAGVAEVSKQKTAECKNADDVGSMDAEEGSLDVAAKSQIL